jgi:hypothetical protein
MRLRLPLAIALASIGGCVAFCTFLPWGDPCPIAGYSGHPCPIVMSPSQEYPRNAVFVVICVLVGYAAGFFTHAHRYLAGTLSTLFSAILAAIAARIIYAVHSPLIRLDVPGAYTMALIAFVSLALLGALGAAASGWPPNNRWRGP